jgi:hypothetical protein
MLQLKQNVKQGHSSVECACLAWCLANVGCLTTATCRYKQKGKAAEEADNVFHHLTYEGAVDLESMTNKQHRAALESQINEFGQCPRYT